ncbi:hypothetical protein C8F04DRAFT_1188636 [Mycena alexandri]|uniref:Uncharacterized protein n=1 Tax=Mycena alexandri TaxID=1745969 RepID=A0AAD6SI50_9AGAR|nr:hypothetical protein C8F04DRAFT_1188636 [Mycena alexandri]
MNKEPRGGVAVEAGQGVGEGVKTQVAQAGAEHSKVMQNLPSHLILSATLSFVAAIPNHAVRYTALGLTAACTLLYNFRIRSPGKNLRRLQQSIDRTDIRIRYAKAHCPRYHFALAEQTLRLLQIHHSVSAIYCHILAFKSQRFSWTQYRVILNDIAACIKRVESISNVVEHIIEAEHQRQLADDIQEIHAVLTTAPPAAQTYPPMKRCTRVQP